MEKINRPSLETYCEKTYPNLPKLSKNWQQWGIDYHNYLTNQKEGKGKIRLGEEKSKEIGQDFSWRENIYDDLRNALISLTDEHCSFCDNVWIEQTSKKTIEHYYPKAEYPLKAYEWSNLFYCCDQCQKSSNRTRTFVLTIKPDEDYSFDKYFYFDADSGKVEVLESLEKQDHKAFNCAKDFLIRYDINNKDRTKARQSLYKDIINAYILGDSRIRNDYSYRYIYDAVRDWYRT